MDEHVMSAESSSDVPSEPGLRRTLGTVTSIAIAFSAGGVSAGIYSLFGFSLATAGPAFLWGWVMVGIGTFLLCLMWSELASHYPLAGVMYEWPRKISGAASSWWVGWVYLFAMMFQLAGIYFILPAVVFPLLGVEGSTGGRLGIALVALVIAAIANIAAIEKVGRLVVIATVAELVLIFGITLAVLVLGHEQSPSVLFDPAVPGQSFSSWLPAFLGGGVFIGLWVLQSFEAGGAIGEETIDAPRRAPRAILVGWAGSFFVGLFTIVAFLLAVPDFATIGSSANPVVDIIDGSLAGWVGKVYLALLAMVILLGANVVFTLVSRQMYGMARAGLLPFSAQLTRTHPRTGEPWCAVLATAVITAVPFIFSDEFAVLATGATGAIYLVYFAMMCLLLKARLSGWPHDGAPMRLGRWGIPLNVLALVYSGGMLVNLMWFRDATNPDWKLGIPVGIWLLAIPVLLGVVHQVAGRRRAGSVSASADRSGS